jgi:hypothetical protein
MRSRDEGFMLRNQYKAQQREHYVKLEVLKDVAPPSLDQWTRGMEVDIVKRSCQPIVVTIGLRRRRGRAIWIWIHGLKLCLRFVIGTETLNKFLYLCHRGEGSLRRRKGYRDRRHGFVGIIAVQECSPLCLVDGGSVRR